MNIYLILLLGLCIFCAGFLFGIIWSAMFITKRYKGTFMFWKYKGLSEVVGKKPLHLE